MGKTMKLVYVMILFLSLFLVAKNVNGMTFFHYFQVSFFALYLVHNLYLILVILYYFLFSADIRCMDDFECRRSAICLFPKKWKCNNHQCECV